MLPYREFGYNSDGQKNRGPNSERSKRKGAKAAKAKGLPPAPPPGKAHPKKFPTAANGKRNFSPFYNRGVKSVY